MLLRYRFFKKAEKAFLKRAPLQSLTRLGSSKIILSKSSVWSFYRNFETQMLLLFRLPLATSWPHSTKFASSKASKLFKNRLQIFRFQNRLLCGNLSFNHFKNIKTNFTVNFLIAICLTYLNLFNSCT